MSGMEPDEPRRARPAPRALDAMSVADLETYIAELEAEIARVRGAIRARQDHRSSADRFFKS